MAIPCVGKCFSTSEEFMAYLETIQFGAWRPKFVTMHHTGGPDLQMWQGWQRRSPPVTDEQWLLNLASYYGKSKAQGGPEDGPWRSGPHFFFTPSHYCVLSPPTARGVHAKSFNATSWGVECVGNFDVEPFTEALRDRYAEGLACLHIAAGLDVEPFSRGLSGLHFHRDDPKTTKTCPGRKVSKEVMVAAIRDKMSDLTDGSHEDDEPPPAAVKSDRFGMVNTGDLKIRTDAGAKYPVVGALAKGAKVMITGDAKNGETLWYRIPQGWIAARYVTLN